MSSLDNSNGCATTKEAAAAAQKTSASESQSTKPSRRPTVYKSASERMAESVYLVKQLTDVGISSTHPHMKPFRDLLNRWIREPDYSYNGRVDFDAYGRRGDLVLPRVPGHVASMRLRSID